MLFLLFISSISSAQETSRVIPFSAVPTSLCPLCQQDLTVQLWDADAGGHLLYSEAHSQVQVDIFRRIKFLFGSGNPNGLDPVDFPTGTSRYLDVVDSSGNTVLQARLPLSAAAFALSPGPQGPPGPQGEPGPAGPPGAPGKGTVTQVNSGFGLLGGPITTTGTLSLDTSATNSLYAQLNAANTFNGNQSINGALAVTASNGFIAPNTINVFSSTSGDAAEITSAVFSGQALHTRCMAPGSDCLGIWAEGTSFGGLFVASQYGVVANAPIAGRFIGDVEVTGTLTKGAGAFKIDHPLDPANKYLIHSFVESPEMMNIYNGTVLLDSNGETWVALPDWFEALNRDFRYQLTAIGAPSPNLYIAAEVSGNRFKIAGGQPGTKVSWQVTGVRHDAYADLHRLPLEEDKPAEDRGYYLHPEAFGLPADKNIFRKHLQERKHSAATPQQNP